MTKKEEAIKFFENKYHFKWIEKEDGAEIRLNNSFYIWFEIVGKSYYIYGYDDENDNYFSLISGSFLEDLISIIHLYYLNDELTKEDLLNDGTSPFFDKIKDNQKYIVEEITLDKLHINFDLTTLNRWQKMLGESGTNSKKRVREEIQATINGVLEYAKKEVLKGVEHE